MQSHPVDDGQLICYSEQADDRSSIILVVVGLDPQETPARIFRIRRHLRTEHDFDYHL